MELGLAGKKALVTGSTKGIGRAIVESLLDEGVDVAICARNSEEVGKAIEDLSKYLMVFCSFHFLKKMSLNY